MVCNGKIKWVIITEKSLVYETRSAGVEIKNRTMSTPMPLYKILKRVGDIFFSSLGLILFVHNI